MGGFKKYIFEDVVLSVIGLGGAKNGGAWHRCGNREHANSSK